MITNFICFVVGGFVGLITMALAVVAGDADKCNECVRMREKLERERNEQNNGHSENDENVVERGR